MATANESVKDREPEAAVDGLINGQEPYITKPKVARRLEKCTRTVDNLMREGLPHYKLGRSVIFKWSEVVAHLAENCRVSRRAK